MKGGKKNIIIAWVAYQRRTESLAKYYDLDVYYHHYPWEEKYNFLKPVSYIFKFIQTFITLFKTGAKFVFVQVPPTFPIYAVMIWCKITKAKYIVDCHNTMLYDDGPWIKFPLAKYMLRKSAGVLIHNQDIMNRVQHLQLPAFLVPDPIPEIAVDKSIQSIRGIDIQNEKYIIVPCSFAGDEPIQELFDAMELSSGTHFICTWFKERLPAAFQHHIPQNLRLTGFLDEKEFNALHANAIGSIVLTTREGTQPSGAAEAIALEVPLIISDIATTRNLYNEAGIFVNNTASSIADGIQYALQNEAAIKGKLKTLKQKLKADINHHLLAFKDKIDQLQTIK